MGLQARIKQAMAGVTLIELSVVLVVLAIFTCFAILSFGNLDESRDATAVQTVQTSLQGMVTQAADRLDVDADTLNQNNIINAMQLPPSGNMSMTGSGGAQYVLTMPQGGRTATYQVEDDGDVVLLSLTGFTKYEVQDGVIQKTGS